MIDRAATLNSFECLSRPHSQTDSVAACVGS